MLRNWRAWPLALAVCLSLGGSPIAWSQQSPQSTAQQSDNASKPASQSAEAKPQNKPVAAQATNDNGSAGNKDEAQSNDKPSDTWVVWFVGLFETHDKFWVAFGTVVIAAFTAILGFSTVFLWRATTRLVDGAEDASRRQLRPYVIVKGKGIQQQDETHGRFVHRLQVVNTGQTPAYNLRTSSRCHVVDHPIPISFDYAFPLGENQSVMMLGPGQKTGHHSYADKHLTPIELIKIKSQGPWRLYNHGTIIYEDTFGTEYWTNFCYFFEFQWSTNMATGLHDSTIAAQAAPHHNDAT